MPVRLPIRLRTFVALVAMGVGVSGSAAAQTPAKQSAPRPFEGMSLAALSTADSVVALARAQLGKRYRTGGQSPDRGFDCSGLVRFVMAGLRLDVPRTSRLQAQVGQQVPRDTNRLRPGDLLTFGPSRKGGVSHVGIYVGNGRYIHASSVAGRVIESPLDRPPSSLVRAWQGARRLFATDDSVTVTVAGSPDPRG